MKKYTFFLDGKKSGSNLFPNDDIRVIYEVMKYFESKGIKVIPEKGRKNKNSTALYFQTIK